MALIGSGTFRRLFSFSIPFFAALVVFLHFSLGGKRIDKSAASGFSAIDSNTLRRHIGILASDSLEGRGTATPGGWKAAAFIAARFREMGIKPAGDGGSYFQRMDFYSVGADQSGRVDVKSGSRSRSFELEEDFYPPYYVDFDTTTSVVFVGFSDAAYDSATAARMAGKIVIMLSGPRSLARDTSAESFGRKAYSYNYTPSCAATFVVCDDIGSASYKAIVAKASAYRTAFSFLVAADSKRQFSYFRSFYVSSKLADAIFRSSGYSLSELRRKALRDSVPSALFLDHTSVTIRSVQDRSAKPSDNVIGCLEGSDPVLKDQTVVYCAHYDHMGKLNDSTIYRGADDNGSGSAGLLAIAHAYAVNPVRPRRSILFMAFTAEELGLLGSDFYVRHPLHPLDSLAVVIDLDMIGRSDNVHRKNPSSPYVYVLGSDRVDYEVDLLLNHANEESEGLGLDYRYNNERNRFIQGSDSWSFARIGIPVIQFFTGIHDDYHTPRDTPDKILYDKATRITRLAFYTGWKLANSPNRFGLSNRTGVETP